MHYFREFAGKFLTAFGTAADATQVVNTVLATFDSFPLCWKDIELVKLGLIYNSTFSAVGITTAAKVKLSTVVAGVTTDCTNQVTVETTGAAYGKVEVDLNTTTGNLRATTNPAYPTMGVESADLSYLQVRVGTQGVGGTQSVKPYVVFRILPIPNED